MSGPRLGPDDLAAVERIMVPADEALARGYPGDSGTRQPVHTVYLPADRVLPGTAQRYGAAARAALEEHAPDPGTLAGIVGADPDRVAASKHLNRTPQYGGATSSASVATAATASASSASALRPR